MDHKKSFSFWIFFLKTRNTLHLFIVMTTKTVLVSRRQIITTVNFITLTCFPHIEPLMLLQTVKKHLRKDLFFSKTIGGYPIASLKNYTYRQVFFHILSDIGGFSSQIIFLVSWWTLINRTAIAPQFDIFNKKLKYIFRCLP